MCVCVYLCAQTCVFICIYTHMYIYTHIHSPHLLYPFESVGGLLCCFRVFAVVNSDAVNIEVQESFKPEFCLDACPGVGLLDHMASLLLVF